MTNHTKNMKHVKTYKIFENFSLKTYLDDMFDIIDDLVIKYNMVYRGTSFYELEYEMAIGEALKPQMDEFCEEVWKLYPMANVAPYESDEYGGCSVSVSFNMDDEVFQEYLAINNPEDFAIVYKHISLSPQIKKKYQYLLDSDELGLL